MNAKIFIKTKTKQINLKRNQIGALNRIESTLFTNNRDRKWCISVLGFFQCFSKMWYISVSDQSIAVFDYPKNLTLFDTECEKESVGFLAIGCSF